MFNEAPTHQDRARAMRSVLAMLRNDGHALKYIAMEINDDPRDVDRLLWAVTDMFAAFMRRHTTDPHRHAAAWIEHELRQADPEDDPW